MFKNEDEREIAVKFTEHSYRNRVFYPNCVRSNPIKKYVRPENQDKADELLHKMAVKNYAGWYYNKASDSYSIYDKKAAKEFVNRNGGDLP